MSAPSLHQVATMKSMVEVLRHRAAAQPDDVVYRFLERGEIEGPVTEWTFADLDRRARAIAARLQQLGMQGKHALLLAPPGLEFCASLFGCFYAGVVAVPAYPPNPKRLQRTLPRLLAMIADSDAAVALTSTPLLQMAEAVLPLAPDLGRLRWEAVDALDPALADQWQPGEPEADSLAMLQYTSGSTGAPRGVMITHRNLVHNSWSIHRVSGSSSATRLVTWIPLYHDMGLVTGIIQPVHIGLVNTLMSPLDFLQKPVRWLDAISRWQATHSGGANFAYDLCCSRITAEERARLDLRSWRVAFSGGEPIRAATLARFAETFAPQGFSASAPMPCYGLAEVTAGVCWKPHDRAPAVHFYDRDSLARRTLSDVAPDSPRARAQVGSGCAPDDTLVVVVDPDSRVPVRSDQIGELWVSGPSVARGYWKRDDDTRDKFNATVAGTEGPAFLRTGDLGFVRGDEVFVTGRIQDLLIVRGKNHYPQDLEHTVDHCSPGLRPGACAAFAVELDNEERVVVAVEAGASVLDTESAERIAEVVRRAVLDEHELLLHAVALLPPGSIHKTSSGKIQRRSVRETFEGGTLEHLAIVRFDVPACECDCDEPEELSPTSTPEERVVWFSHMLVARIAARAAIPVERIDVKAHLAELGLDSTLMVEVSGELAQELDITLSPTVLYEYPSITLLARHLAGIEDD